MSNIGFVYILCNDFMPSLFKLGCTERSPQARSQELSNCSGVPTPFQVVCYLEVDDFQKVERLFHQTFSEHRVSSNREFFYTDCLRSAVHAMFWHPGKHSFCIVYPPFLYENAVYEGIDSLFDSSNPWKRPEQESPVLLAVVSQENGAA